MSRNKKRDSKMKSTVKLQNIVILIAFIVFLNAGIAHAGIAVTPERHILKLGPGEEAGVDYKIYNSGEEDIHIRVDVREWTKSAGNKDIDIDSWLFIENKEFDVEAGKTQPLNVKVKAPDKATGEMVAMIFLCYQERKSSPLHLRHGNPLYLIIKGTEKHDARIDKIDCVYFKDPRRNNRSCLQVSVNIANTGNIHIKPDIKLDITDKKANVLQQLEIKDGHPIFSGQNYAYKLEWWDADLAEGTYAARVTVAYQDKIKLPEKSIKFEFSDGKVKLLEAAAK